MGWLIAFASTLCFSVGTPVARGAILLGVDPSALLVVRLLLTTGLLFAATLLTERTRLRIDRRGLLWCVLTGLVNGVGMLAYFWSLTRVNSSIAAMIFSVSPLVVLVLLAMRGEKYTRRTGLRLLLGLGGVYLLIGPGGHVDLIGVLLAALAVVTVPFQLVIMQWFLQGYDSRTVTLYTVGTMTIVVSVWWWVGGAHWVDPGRQGWVLIIVLAIVCTFFSRLLMFMAISRIGGGQVGLMAPLETLLTVVWSTVFLQERLESIQWAGGVLILLSAGLAVERLWRVRRKDGLS
jgi:drug/metabolite transporter (DMT)-like permease